ncbi:alpha/beta hydrolase [Roseibium sp.]|uniref:alpha/beta hydrolase n=1 Tax=Roseibium sp. TaxID=1936156 RepID=UPI003A983AAA
MTGLKMFRLHMPGIVPLSVGLLFFSAALTPSLIPRGWLLQGILAGLVMAIGYMLGRFAIFLWTALEFPKPRGRLLTFARTAVLLPALALLIHNLSKTTDWQNSVRLHVDMEPIESTTIVGIVLLSLAVFSALFLIGVAIQRIFDILRFRLYRYMAPRAAGVLGLAVLLTVAFIASRDWVLPATLQFLDTSYETAQNLFDTAPPPPGDPDFPGGANSLVSWKAMGQPGRNFIMGGPTAAEISDFTGRTAKKPIRVYVGRSQDKSPKARAQLALQELIRLKAFDRKILLVASPTGTGWLDPGSHDILEMMHDGDVATVAVQYSYLQSPLALVFETRTGLDQASATMDTIYRYWRQLPEDGRPRLYMHGISLGAWSSMYSFDIIHMINEPIAGALWSGPPFPSAHWLHATAARNSGTPFVLPRIEDGEVIRFASQYVTPQEQGSHWGRVRIVFLQYASDPIVFFDPNSFWRSPQWMREKPAPDVSPELTFMPVVTQLQLALDMLLATHLPQRHGHNYDKMDYIDAWAAVTGPAGWTAEDTAALKSLCSAVEGIGCSKSAAERLSRM